MPSTGALGGELGAHEVDAVLAPEELAVDDEGRHGEHALLLGLLPGAGRVSSGPALVDEGIEARGIDADFLQERFDGGAILVVELALEEARIGGDRSAPCPCRWRRRTSRQDG